MAIGESKKRSIVKMLTYRAILTALLAIISWIFTGNLGQTTVITIVFSVSATVIYYIHERVWNASNGKDNRLNSSTRRSPCHILFSEIKPFSDCNSSRMEMRCADCGCLPSECMASPSLSECPNCNCEECCCWR